MSDFHTLIEIIDHYNQKLKTRENRYVPLSPSEELLSAALLMTKVFHATTSVQRKAKERLETILAEYEYPSKNELEKSIDNTMSKIWELIK